MNEKQVKAGAIVLSSAGRDRGKHYILLKALSGNKVLVSDGKYKPLENPKKKNIKHLIYAKLDSEIVKGIENQTLSNEQISYTIKLFISGIKKNGGIDV